MGVPTIKWLSEAVRHENLLNMMPDAAPGGAWDEFEKHLASNGVRFQARPTRSLNRCCRHPHDCAPSADTMTRAEDAH
eukprot:3883091-Alexandrium_andersonii.AAC.1